MGEVVDFPAPETDGSEEPTRRHGDLFPPMDWTITSCPCGVMEECPGNPCYKDR